MFFYCFSILYIAVLLPIANTWKPKCPWTNEWIRKMWYIYTVEYYSVIKEVSEGFVKANFTQRKLSIFKEISQYSCN